MVLALGLFVLEAKYPTHGVLGVGGVISMVLGALFLIRTPWTGMGVRFAVPRSAWRCRLGFSRSF